MYKSKDLSVGRSVYLRSSHYNKNSYLNLKSNFVLGNYVTIDYSGGLTIGNNATISDNTMIFTHEHQLVPFVQFKKNLISFSELIIDDYVWDWNRNYHYCKCKVYKKRLCYWCGIDCDKRH